MEFNDINTKRRTDSETSFYGNTKIISRPLKSNANSKPAQPENDEGLYEQLRFERKTPLKEEDTLKRIKCLMYIILTLGTVLCVAVIAVIIVVAVPKDQDGGWTSWGSWVSCSASYGGGVQSRARTCSNPLPSQTGKYCDGSPVEVKACKSESCKDVDGGWTSWGSWVSCSETCGGGVQSRARTCSNPLPSLTGKYCDGSPVQVKTCNKELCADGGWSLWEKWGSCTESCGGGTRTRTRSCINPTPSLTGRPCVGKYTGVSRCNRTTCPEHIVAFTAYNIHRNSSRFATLRFQSTYTNIGNAYNTNTGKFTCNLPGVYHFVVTLIKVYMDIDSINAYLRINGRYMLIMHLNPKDDGSNEIGTYMLTGAGTFHLNRNDVVDVYGVPTYFYHNNYSYFTGFLITPDQ